jgi:hypothetical protein
MDAKPADDLMVGAKAIATWMGVTERQVYYWAETRRFRIFKIGDKLAGRKSTLSEDLAKLENGEAA